MQAIERMPTGIPGLDDLMEGGLPRGRITLVTGAAGSGKTTLGMQFLWSGATEHAEAGAYVTLEEEAEDLRAEMGRYGWDLARLEEEKRFCIIQSPVPFEVAGVSVSLDQLLDAIHAQVVSIDARRIVFDSVAALGLPYGDPIQLRRDLHRLCAMLRELGCTALLLTERPEEESRITRYDIEQFVAQGVILLHLSRTYRGIEVRKMRGTKHDTNVHTLRITEKGIVIHPGEHPF
jgi:KaiC/GvpD/RAD55 family RecA-like ATPase